MGGIILPFMIIIYIYQYHENMKAYTSYPLDCDSEVTEIEVLSYDRNKYCAVLKNGIQYEIKRGYIWKDLTLTESFPKIQWYLLPTQPLGDKPTKRQAYREMKHDNRKKLTLYTLGYGDTRKQFKNLNDALIAFSSLNQDCWLLRYTNKGYSFTSATILERVNGWLYIVGHKRDFRLKINHVNKYKIQYFKAF